MAQADYIEASHQKKKKKLSKNKEDEKQEY